MIERLREVRRRRQRQEKRRKLRAKLARTTDAQERAAIGEKIQKTFRQVDPRLIEQVKQQTAVATKSKGSS